MLVMPHFLRTDFVVAAEISGDASILQKRKLWKTHIIQRCYLLLGSRFQILYLRNMTEMYVQICNTYIVVETGKFMLYD